MHNVSTRNFATAAEAARYQDLAQSRAALGGGIDADVLEREAQLAAAPLPASAQATVARSLLDAIVLVLAVASLAEDVSGPERAALERVGSFYLELDRQIA